MMASAAAAAAAAAAAGGEKTLAMRGKEWGNRTEAAKDDDLPVLSNTVLHSRQ